MKINDIKAVFFDIDGTLFDHFENKVWDSTIKAIELLRKKGIKVILCSGRPKEMADELNFLDKFEYDGYIGCSGGQIFDENNKLIYDNLYSDLQLKQIFDIADKYKYVAISFGKYKFATRELDKNSKLLVEEFHLVIDEIRKWNHERLTAVSVVIPDGCSSEMFNNIEGLSYHRSTSYCIDFICDHVNKALGIKQMLNYLNLDNASFLAFGDSENDIPMFEAATISFCMENGAIKAKEKADYIIGPSNSNTIYETLKSFKLI